MCHQYTSKRQTRRDTAFSGLGQESDNGAEGEQSEVNEAEASTVPAASAAERPSAKADGSGCLLSVLFCVVGGPFFHMFTLRRGCPRLLCCCQAICAGPTNPSPLADASHLASSVKVCSLSTSLAYSFFHIRRNRLVGSITVIAHLVARGSKLVSVLRQL